MNLLTILKENIAQVLELIKAFLAGSTTITKNHKNSEEMNNSYSIPNSAVILVAVSIFGLIAGTIWLLKYFKI